MSSRYLYLVRMDVAHDHEPTFNEVYDSETPHCSVPCPACGRAAVTGAVADTPRYIAAYELESAAVLQSAAWKAAG